MIIRHATTWDAEKLTEMWVKAVEESWMPFNGFMSDETKERYFLRLLVKIKSPSNLVLVVEEEGKIIGFSKGYIYEEEYSLAPIAHLDGWYVETEHRGSKAASMLYNVTMEWAKQARKVEFRTINEEKIIKAWGRKGWKPVLVTYEKEAEDGN